MTVALRPFDADTDSARLAELMNTVCRHLVTEAELRERERAQPEGRMRFRVVAVTTEPDGERVVGYGETGRDPWMSPGCFWFDLIVDPAARHQGIGTMLYDDLLQFAWELGATRLVAQVGDHTPEGLRFILTHGFQLGPHGVALDLAAAFGVTLCGEAEGAGAAPLVPELAGNYT
jgi:GNAT superfamily N-acetyltransferase